MWKNLEAHLCFAHSRAAVISAVAQWNRIHLGSGLHSIRTSLHNELFSHVVNHECCSEWLHLNSHYREGKTQYFLNVGCPFSTSPEKECIVLHWVVRMDIDTNNCVENKIKRERRRSSNAGSFLTSAQLANHMIISFWTFLEMVRHGPS